MRSRAEGCFFSGMRHSLTRHRGRALAAAGPLLAAALATACGGGLTPSPAPTPAAVAAPSLFVYAPGERHALFEGRATVRVAGDTSAVTDTVVTRLYATLRLTAGSTARSISGTVDSVAVASTGRAAPGSPPLPSLPAPLGFAGTVDGGTVRVSIPPAAAADCASPAGTYLTIARDLLPSLPARLPSGASWSETVAATSCRGGVVLTTTATHRYTVRDTTSHAGRLVTRIARTTSYRLSGEGAQAGVPVKVDGEGSGEGELLVDVAAGELLTTIARSTLNLSFSAAGRVQRVVQDGVQSVTLSP